MAGVKKNAEAKSGEQSFEAVEKATEKRIAEEKKIAMIIPVDPNFKADEQFWEHCVNGVIYRYQRGVEIQIPASLAETVLRKIRLQKESAVVIGEFAGTGKKIEA